MRSLSLIVLLCFACLAVAEVEIGRGGIASCTPLINDLKSRWSDVRNHMTPPGARITRAEAEHFVCVSPNVTQQAIPRRADANSNFQFYSNPMSGGLGIVCDKRLSACAMLNPGLFPELQRKQNEDVYEPPKSQWVKPPSDGDQWNSN